MKNQRSLEAFRDMPVSQAVMKNTLPAMAAMLMVLIYNLADTFFIGRTGSALLVAAVSLATPVFLIFMAVGGVFGIGGASAISRAIGEGRQDYAKKVCSFCMWGCAAAGAAMSAFFLLSMDQILDWIGATSDTWDSAKSYLTIVSCCGPFVLIGNCYSNVIRAEGQSGKAMMGQLIGNLLNVALDPLFILVFGWGIVGAAAATVIGNVVGAGCYILYFLRGKSTLSVHMKDCRLGGGVAVGVLAIGIPASLGSLLMSVSQIIVNAMMAGYGDMALAGIGVAMKVTMITGMVCIGFGQGIQPLLGYCVGAGLWDRFKKVMNFSLIFALVFSAVLTGVCYLFIDRLIRAFLTDSAAFDYAVQLARILLTTSFLFGVFYVLSNALQAMGAAAAALAVNLSRQGVIYIPSLLILNTAIGAAGLAWAQPVADVLSVLMAAFLYLRTVQKLQKH